MTTGPDRLHRTLKHDDSGAREFWEATPIHPGSAWAGQAPRLRSNGMS